MTPEQIDDLLIMGVLVLLSAFFSGSETALFYLQRDELRSFRRGGRSERMAAALLESPGRLLSAILLCNLVVNLGYFAIASAVTLQLEESFGAGSAGLFGVASLLALVALGEVLPKSIAVSMRRPLARLVSFPLAAASRVVQLLLPPLEVVTLLSRRAFWPHFAPEPYLTADDLERAVEYSTTEHALSLQERMVLDNVLDLSEIRADEWMHPRSQLRSFGPPLHRDALRGKMPAGGYALVTEEASEEIAAAVPLATLPDVPARHLEHLSEQVVYVPWSASVATVLDELRSRLLGAAVVVNEYGETLGVITYEDILEEVFRKQPSRAGRLLGRQPIRRVDGDRYHVEGMTSLRVLAGFFLLPYKSGRSVTIAGHLQDQLGRLPEVGDTGQWEQFGIEVLVKGDPAYFLLELKRHAD